MKYFLGIFLFGCVLKKDIITLMEVRQLKMQFLELQKRVDLSEQRCQRLEDRVFMLEDRFRLRSERIEVPQTFFRP